VSGLLEVDVTVLSTGKKASLVIDKLAGDLSEGDIKAALAKMARLKIHPRDEAANRHLFARIEAAYAMARAEQRDWVKQMLVALELALEAQDKPALAALRAELHSQLDQFEAHFAR
jgi:molecular chaperone HscC